MTLAKGDHLVIKRGGKILGPEDEGHHEFEVMNEHPYMTTLVMADGTPCPTSADGTSSPTSGDWFAGKEYGKDYYPQHTVLLKMVR